METEKPTALEQRLVAAKERREKQQKEREVQRSEMVTKLEETEKRRQEISTKREAVIEAKKEHTQSRHEEAQKRREVQMRVRREKLLNDVEKGDRLTREAKRRNRHSWGGNINAGGDDLPDRPRPTVLSKPMQNWISGLRNYDDDDTESIASSYVSQSPRDRSYHVPERLLTPTASSRAKRYTPDGYNIYDCILKSDIGKMKRRTVSSADINRLSQPKSRTVSKDRGQPDGVNGMTRTRSAMNISPGCRFSTTRSRSRQSSRDDLYSPRPMPEGKESRSTSKESPCLKSTKFTTTTISKKQITPKVKSTKTTTTPKTSIAYKTKVTPVAKSTPKPAVQSKTIQSASPTNSVALKKQIELEDPDDAEPISELKSFDESELVLSDYNDTCASESLVAEVSQPLSMQVSEITQQPDIFAANIELCVSENLGVSDSTKEAPFIIESEIKQESSVHETKDVTNIIYKTTVEIKTPEKPKFLVSEAAAAVGTENVIENSGTEVSNFEEITTESKDDKIKSEISFSSVTLKKVATRVSTEYKICQPTRDYPIDDRSPADQSAGDISIGSSEVIYEEREAVKNLASKFNHSIQVSMASNITNESMTSIVSSSMTSMTSTDTDKDTIKSENQDGTDSPCGSDKRKSVSWNAEIQKIEQIMTENIHGPQEADMENKETKKKNKKRNKKKKKDPEKPKKPKKSSTKHSMVSSWLMGNDDQNGDSESVTLDPSPTITVETTEKIEVGTEDYKRRMEEKKREHLRKKQEDEENERRRLEDVREQAKQEESERLRLKAERTAQIDAKFEEEKRKLEEKMNINFQKSIEEKEQKKRLEEEQRKARKERIAAIMKRTRESNIEEPNLSASGDTSEGVLRTTSTESGTSSVADITSRVDSLLGSFRKSDGLNIHRVSPNQSAQDQVNQAVPSVQ